MKDFVGFLIDINICAQGGVHNVIKAQLLQEADGFLGEVLSWGIAEFLSDCDPDGGGHLDCDYLFRIFKLLLQGFEQFFLFINVNLIRHKGRIGGNKYNLNHIKVRI